MYLGLAALGTKMYPGQPALGAKKYPGQPALGTFFIPRAGSPRSKEVNRAGCPIFNICSIFQKKCPRASPNVIELNILKFLNIQKNLGIFKFEYPNILKDIKVSWGISQCHRDEY